MGEIQVPDDRYYGAQTARALIHFDIGEERMPQELIRAFGILKKAAAIVNRELGKLSPHKVRPHRTGGRRSLEGTLNDHFPLRIWQTGSGTQTNMNANEVISNRAVRLPAGGWGQGSGSSERRRQYGAVFKRHVSRCDAYRGRKRDPQAVDPQSR